MPFYDYKCEDCKYGFTKLQKISEDVLTICPECKGSLKKIMSLPAPCNVEYGNPKENYEMKMEKEVKQIAKKINDGDEEEIANFFGQE